MQTGKNGLGLVLLTHLRFLSVWVLLRWVRNQQSTFSVATIFWHR